MKALAVVSVLALALIGCTHPRGRGELGMTLEQLDAKDDSVCGSFGLRRGQPGYADCRLRLRSDRSTQDSARRIGVVAAFR